MTDTYEVCVPAGPGLLTPVLAAFDAPDVDQALVALTVHATGRPAGYIAMLCVARTGGVVAVARIGERGTLDLET